MIMDCKKKTTIDEFKSKGRGGDNGKRVIINESGLYRLIARSNKTEALKFQTWVFNEVTPSIREPGSYSVQPKIEAPRPETKEIVVPGDCLEAIEALSISLRSEKQLKKDVTIARRTVQQATREIAKYKPKAKILDQLEDATGLVNLTDCAKILELSPHGFIAQLRKDKILYRPLRINIPYQKYIDKGWLRVIMRRAKDDPTHCYPTRLCPL
jgi:prophage antirepressor-like protein